MNDYREKKWDQQLLVLGLLPLLLFALNFKSHARTNAAGITDDYFPAKNIKK